MTLQSYIGSSLYVVKATPTALTETALEALFAAGASPAPAKVGQLMMLPELGDTINTIEVPQLELGRVQRIVGQRDGGTALITVAYDAADGGQTILRDGAGSNDVHTFKIQDGHATTSAWYFTAILASLRYAAREGTNAYQFTMEVYPQSDLLGPYDPS